MPNPITQLIDFLHLPPTQSSLNLLSKIKSIPHKNFIHYYIPHNNQILHIYSTNLFATISNPSTTYLTYHPTLQHLLNTF